MGRAQFVGISESIDKQRTAKRLPVLTLCVTTKKSPDFPAHFSSTTPASLNQSHFPRKSPQMLYESFKGLKLTSRPGTQGNKLRPWQDVGVNDGNGNGFDLHKLHDLAAELTDERTADELAKVEELEAVDEQVSF